MKRTHGGKRPNAGRPRVGKFSRSFFVTDGEYKKLLQLFSKLKAERKAVSYESGPLQDGQS